MKYITQTEAIDIDNKLVELGFTIDTLIEIAGQCIYEVVLHLIPRKQTKVLICIGPGNNGSDGLVLSRLLHMAGYDVTVYCYKVKHEKLLNICRKIGVKIVQNNVKQVVRDEGLGKEGGNYKHKEHENNMHKESESVDSMYKEHENNMHKENDNSMHKKSDNYMHKGNDSIDSMHKDTLYNAYEHINAMQQKVIDYAEENVESTKKLESKNTLDSIDPMLNKEFDYIIDCIFGFSFKGNLREPYLSMINFIKENKKIISVDVPSSYKIDENNNEVKFVPICTIALVAPKICSKGTKIIVTRSFVPKEVFYCSEYTNYMNYVELEKE